jgi:hypothetical protein
MNKRPIATEALQPAAQRICDHDTTIIRPDPARRRPFLGRIAARRQAGQDPPIDVEALHRTPPWLLPHGHIDAL